MIARAVILSALIAAAGLCGIRGSADDPPAGRAALRTFPRVVDGWHAVADVPLDEESLQVLGVDDYVNRRYLGPSGQPVSLYIGYYASQRQGDTIHSPQNCLPGAGWEPIAASRQTLPDHGAAVSVNRYVVQKGLDRMLVLYWYEGRGRIVANEYASRFWLMIDAARLHRSNGSLVRVISPLGDGHDEAAVSFSRALLPRLAPYLP
ncbi:MAG TPA: EpsI family protein [Vicinamibacterales bacterium]|nr:EpsI family protein [Vicinamibacterales bacterium]